MNNKNLSMEVQQLLMGIDENAHKLITETILSDYNKSSCVVYTYNGLVSINTTKPLGDSENIDVDVIFTFVTSPTKFQKNYRLTINDIYEVFGWLWQATKEDK